MRVISAVRSVLLRGGLLALAALSVPGAMLADVASGQPSSTPASGPAGLIPGPGTFTYHLRQPWTLLTWYGADGMPIVDALQGEGQAAGWRNIMPGVTAVYAWDGARWDGFFPRGVGVPGANDLETFRSGEVYWISVKVPKVAWVIAADGDIEP